MCSSENELIPDVRQVDLEDMIMKNEEQFVMVRLPLTDEQRMVAYGAPYKPGRKGSAMEASILAIGTPIPPCADVETVDLSEYMPEYHDQGMGCGLEDRGITDRYEAMGYGWDQALERVCSELPEMVHRTDMEAQVARVAAEKDAVIKELIYVLGEVQNLSDGSFEPKDTARRKIYELVTAALNEGAAG
ncbi:hypothetical protein [Komagataeibacter xylinus]|uniref:Uncharacterized protein n=1 Tax=Komagataeibacter xylinus TaxID=28448 RepID=A0A857FIZ2_KOMXY|nr:hypothetical protein [Komagataeibacter xylinus]QHC34125.1 hypothetical protein FMA36_00095 [Komagataeibacter xylinus]